MATAMKQVGIGTPLSRVDGPAKVTGAAKYAAEHKPEGMLYGWIVSSAITKGRIVSIDDSAAKAIPGVVAVMTHENRPDTAYRDSNYRDQVAPPGEPFKALYSDQVQYAMQPVALVLAETLEAARAAAPLVHIEYEREAFSTDWDTALKQRYHPKKERSSFTKPKDRGDADAAYDQSPVQVMREFHLATEHHNPMEMHATTVEWHGDGSVTVHDKTQGAQNVAQYLSNAFGMKADQIKVMNPYVGGGFGSGLRPQYQVYMAVLAAKFVERSVRVVMTRQQMWTHVHRPEAYSQVKLGAEPDGKLLAIANDAVTATSRFEDNMEDVVIWGMINYDCPNAKGTYDVAPRDTYTSGDMRAPGAATGMTLFEMAMDELAYETGVDPLELRLKNYSMTDQMHGLPFTSKALKEAYKEAAERFGWSKRNPEPRSMKDGRELVGWGMATGIWDAMFSKTSARARLTANGHLEVASATADIGTGTYTVMTQIAAETLGLEPDQITVKMGDSTLPNAPVEGGSWAAASSGYATQVACRALGEELVKAAGRIEGDPLGGAKIADVRFEGGRIVLLSDPSVGVSFADAMRAAGKDAIEVEETGSAGLSGSISQLRKARNTHSAIFAEVKVDEELGQVRVTRIVSAVAAGRIINPKTARSQILGGVVMGIGMALEEESMMDAKLGRWMNHNLAEYHVPVMADIHDIDVIFVDEVDPEVTPLGVKGVGEIGLVSTAAAVANAIFHATGKRHHALPITLDKVLED